MVSFTLELTRYIPGRICRHDVAATGWIEIQVVQAKRNGIYAHFNNPQNNPIKTPWPIHRSTGSFRVYIASADTGSAHRVTLADRCLNVCIVVACDSCTRVFKNPIIDENDQVQMQEEKKTPKTRTRTIVYIHKERKRNSTKRLYT